jgi:hypothetical protein
VKGGGKALMQDQQDYAWVWLCNMAVYRRWGTRGNSWHAAA